MILQNHATWAFVDADLDLIVVEGCETDIGEKLRLGLKTAMPFDAREGEANQWVRSYLAVGQVDNRSRIHILTETDECDPEGRVIRTISVERAIWLSLPQETRHKAFDALDDLLEDLSDALDEWDDQEAPPPMGEVRAIRSRTTTGLSLPIVPLR